jgi:hypothetical protein
MKTYRGYACGIGTTARKYETAAEAITAASKMAARHMRRARINGQLPECKAIKEAK